MSSIDDQIRKALSEEDQKVVNEIDNQAGLFEMIGMLFTGKQAWMSYYMWIMGLVAFVAGIYFLSLYFAAEDIKTSLSWALAIIACIFVIALIKIIGWMQMMKLELMREIKRLEMRIMLVTDQKREDTD